MSKRTTAASRSSVKVAMRDVRVAVRQKIEAKKRMNAAIYALKRYEGKLEGVIASGNYEKVTLREWVSISRLEIGDALRKVREAEDRARVANDCWAEAEERVREKVEEARIAISLSETESLAIEAIADLSIEVK